MVRRLMVVVLLVQFLSCTIMHQRCMIVAEANLDFILFTFQTILNPNLHTY